MPRSCRIPRDVVGGHLFTAKSQERALLIEASIILNSLSPLYSTESSNRQEAALLTVFYACLPPYQHCPRNFPSQVLYSE